MENRESALSKFGSVVKSSLGAVYEQTGRGRESKQKKDAYNTLKGAFDSIASKLTPEQKEELDPVYQTALQEAYSTGKVSSGLSTFKTGVDLISKLKEQTPLEKQTEKAQAGGAKLKDYNADGVIDMEDIGQANINLIRSQKEWEKDLEIKKDAVKYGVEPMEGETTGELAKRTLDRQIEFSARKAAASQEAKDQLKAQQIQTRGQLKTSTLSNTWIDMMDKQMDITGLKPGPQMGLSMLFTDPLKLNEFEEAFTGTSNDWATSQVAVHMPGSRATQLVAMFKQSRPSKWSTVEGGVENFAASYEGIITSDMEKSPQSYMPMGHEFNAANPDDVKLLDAKKKIFSHDYKQGMYEQVYNKNPKLLKPETIEKYGLARSSEKVQKLLQRYGG